MSTRIEIGTPANTAVGFARAGYQFGYDDTVPDGMVGLIIQSGLNEMLVIIGTLPELDGLHRRIGEALSEAHSKAHHKIGPTDWAGSTYEYFDLEEETA